MSHLIETDGRCIISECGLFRYLLERLLARTGIVVAFVGVNPSRATKDVPDQTDRKWREFGRRMGARAVLYGNPYAFRATDVSELAGADDPVGPENDHHLREIFAEADIVVPCWGSRDKIPKRLHSRLAAVRNLIRESGKPVRIFGLAKSGDPLHPLMLGYATPLVEWPEIERERAATGDSNG